MTLETTDDTARPEGLLRLCAVSALAWALVACLFLVVHVRLPEGVATTLYQIVSYPIILLPGLTVSLWVCFSTGIGVLAVAKAKSRRSKWIAALAYFMPPIGLAAWWLTLPDSWARALSS